MHFISFLFHFLKTFGFLYFSGDIEMGHWPMGHWLAVNVNDPVYLVPVGQHRNIT